MLLGSKIALNEEGEKKVPALDLKVPGTLENLDAPKPEIAESPMNTGRSIDKFDMKGSRKKGKEMKVTIIGKDNNLTSARFSRASVESDSEPEEKEQPMLLQQRAETVSDNVLLYNVFYNKEQKEEVSPIKKFMSSLSKDNIG
jgi:hypothetical protein